MLTGMGAHSGRVAFLGVFTVIVGGEPPPASKAVVAARESSCEVPDIPLYTDDSLPRTVKSPATSSSTTNEQRLDR
jgi:hypothetical protein